MAGSGGSIKLTWTPTSGATSYNLYYGATADSVLPPPETSGLTTNTITFTGQPAGTTLYFKVAAVHNGAQSGLSAVVAATVLPATPTGLAATSGTGSVTLHWTAGVGATSYSVFQGSSSNGEAATPVAAGITGTSYTVTGLTPGQMYYFEVAGVDAGGASAPSNEAGGTPTTSAPSGLTATGGAASITLTWTATVGAASYSVYQGATAGAEAATPIATGITANSYTVPGLTPGQAYFFKLVAIDAGGQSAMSTEATATVLAAVPGGLSASAGVASIALTWAPSAGATSYSVYQGTSAGAEGATPVATAITGTSYTVADLTPGQTYFFTVVGVDAGGKSGRSAEGSDTVLASVPAGITATAGDGEVTLSWTASPGATSYSIYQGTSAGGEGTTPVTSTGASKTISGLTNGQTYYFKVAAADAGGLSAQSAEASAAPAAPATGGGTTSSGGGGHGGGSMNPVDLLAGTALLIYGWRRRRVGRQ